MKKRLLSALLALCMALSLLPGTALAADDTTAATMQLMKTEGTVSVTNASERGLTVRDNMRLYNGYKAETKASSYAWINLDDTKLTKMDASTKVEVRKNKKNLELLVSSGNLYFNVTSPLAADESLNIRTSTMAVGIRGTCGWTKAIDDYTTEFYVLEGTVECVVGDPRTGETQTVTLNGGDKGIFTVDPTGQDGAKCRITQEQFDVEDIDGFVMDELNADPDLYKAIFGISGFLFDHTSWSLKGNTLAITGWGETPSVGYYAARPWAGYIDQIHNVVISDGVTWIGDNLFKDNTNLTSVTIPNSVTFLGKYAFAGCTSLPSVTFPGVTFISSNAFTGCTSLASVTIPDGVTHIGEKVFQNCTSLTSVTIPDSVTEISVGVFKNCTSLTSVTTPKSLTGVRVLPAETFAGCTSLTSVTIPDGIDWIGQAAFDGCTSLTSVTIPASVTRIMSQAFNGCSSLTDIYYGGSESQWKQVAIETYKNDLLSSATIHYNSTGA